MRQHETMQKCPSALGRRLADHGGNIAEANHILGAGPDDAQPRKDAVVLADMRSKFAVDELKRLQVQVLEFQLLSISLRAIIKAECRVAETVQIPDQSGVLRHDRRRGFIPASLGG